MKALDYFPPPPRFILSSQARKTHSCNSLRILQARIIAALRAWKTDQSAMGKGGIAWLES
jgi:hypothetical protein